MTREEAKRILYVYRAVNLVDASHREAFDMAIKALEQERSRSAEITQYRHDCEKLMEENERLKKALEQESKAVQFAKWIATEIFDEKWEYNKDAFAEIACRKLAKLGIVRAKGDEWELVESPESEE